MAFDDLIRNGVALAHNLTTSLQVRVTHAAWIGQAPHGTGAYYAAPVSRLVLFEQKMRQLQTKTGQTVTSRGKLTFLEPVPPNGTPGRVEPVDTRDKIILPDGTTGPIIDREGLMDPDTSSPYVLEVYLG